MQLATRLPFGRARLRSRTRAWCAKNAALLICVARSAGIGLLVPGDGLELRLIHAVLLQHSRIFIKHKQDMGLGR